MMNRETKCETKETEEVKSESKNPGVTIVEAIYDILFDLQGGNDNKVVVVNKRKKSCFQDGAFLFADAD
jgi:hypothetical protein